MPNVTMNASVWRRLTARLFGVEGMTFPALTPLHGWGRGQTSSRRERQRATLAMRRYGGSMTTPRSDALIFFGATGDLAQKQIWPALQALTKTGRLDMPIVAVGRKDIGVEGIRAKARESLAKAKVEDDGAIEKMVANLRYVAVDYDRPASFAEITRAIGHARRPLAYVALPPEVFETVAEDLSGAGLAKDGRLVIEKPFGHDRASARALARALSKFYPEESVFRIDHYLGKEQVQNIVYFRAANPLFESSWSNAHVSHVEITMAETFGVEDRVGFYERVGAVRDVVQNHLLSVVACVAMELPGACGYEALRERRTKLLSQVKAVSPAELLRGRFDGYLAQEGVAKGSETETFAAMRVSIDSPRWKDVPFFIRTGKELAVTATEVVVHFKGERCPALEDRSPAKGNALRFQLGPNDLITLASNVKTPGEAMAGERRELVLDRSDVPKMKPYERLLGDAIDGDPTLFARLDAVEESWRIVDGALAARTPVAAYAKGSWGPELPEHLIPPGGYSDPHAERAQR